MQLNEQDKMQTVLQLTDVFTTHSQEQVRELCEEFDWNVPNCVDRLINGNSNSNSTTTTTSTTIPATTTNMSNNEPEVDSSTANATIAGTTENENFPLFNQKYHIPHQSGAIPKNKNNLNNNIDNNSGKSNMSANAQAQINNTNTSATSSSPSALPSNNIRNSNSSNSSDSNYFNSNAYRARNNDYYRTCNEIKLGYRVLVIMRGAAGSGKSTLAKKLINQSVDWPNSTKYTMNDYILSTDDFFYTPNGCYNYSQNRIPEAHSWNQRRASQRVRNGLSPIIIDNTNMQIWEMMPYVKIGVQYGYIIEILEPTTSWCNSASKLALRNTHQVSRESIQRALNRFEKVTANYLIQMLKETKYTMSLPQMRLQPPIQQKMPDKPQEHEIDEGIEDIKKEIHENKTNENLSAPETPIKQKQHDEIIIEEFSWSEYEDPNAPKVQRSSKRKRNQPTELTEAQFIQDSSGGGGGGGGSGSGSISVSNNNEKLQQAWQPYEEESVSYWGSQSSTIRTDSSKSKKSLLDLLKESINEEQRANKEPLATSNDENKEKELSLNHHCIDCPNEATGFVALRQMYPNKHITGLWDLYIKCNGDVDWAVDILLREDEFAINDATSNDYVNNDDDLGDFTCKCLDDDDDDNATEQNAASLPPTNTETYANMTVRSQMTATTARPQRQKFARRTSPSLREIQLQIENCFVLRNSKYSKQTSQIQHIRSNIALDTDFPFHNPNRVKPINQQQQSEETTIQLQADEIPNEDCDVDIDVDVDVDGDNELSTDDDDGQQLLEFDLGRNLVEQLCTIFKQESTLGERLPENYATNIFMPRALAKQLYMLWMETVYNQMEEQRQQTLRDDEQFARLLKHPKYDNCKQSPSNISELLDMELTWNVYNSNNIIKEKPPPPNDIATHLTKMKLCEQFPDIPRDTLMQVYEEKNHSYNKTIEILVGNSNINETASDKNETLTQDDLIERAQRENEMLTHEAEAEEQSKRQQDRICDDDNKNSAMQREESKRIVLREFETTRNMAAHHSQLKAECYQKAKDAIQKGNGGAAVYYSEIANLHKKKIDMCNHRAANCIMQVHELTQNNPDLLDLHYLHVIEAVSCLDIFLDQHITALRTIGRIYKNVFIITGRGLHSAGGISTIKNKVKTRLKDRSLKWTDVNPGLLKVKIFSASRHATHI